MKATSVEQVIEDIIRREGGDAYTNRASDRGGPTKFGITAATLGAWRKLGRDATADEVQALEREEAVDIYRAQFITPWNFAFDPLRGLLIDWGVTTSHTRVIRNLQVALAELGYYKGAIDGVVGPKTNFAYGEATVHGADKKLYALVLAARIRFYVGLGLDESARQFLRTHKHTQLHNLAGWVNRCLEFL